jgi:hypothetical protein
VFKGIHSDVSIYYMYISTFNLLDLRMYSKMGEGHTKGRLISEQINKIQESKSTGLI